MAFVVVLHLSPDHQSVADRIIQETTPMPVRQVTEPVPIERNHVYVISPPTAFPPMTATCGSPLPTVGVATTLPLTCSSVIWPMFTKITLSA